MTATPQTKLSHFNLDRINIQHYSRAYSISPQTGPIVFTAMNRVYNTLTSTGSILQHYSRAYSISLQAGPIVFATMNRAYNTFNLNRINTSTL